MVLAESAFDYVRIADCQLFFGDGYGRRDCQSLGGGLGLAVSDGTQKRLPVFFAEDELELLAVGG